jgi:delta-aminolevulinic acid dehydratase/porphobilinogen synthase
VGGELVDDDGRGEQWLDRLRQGDDGEPHRFKRAGADGVLTYFASRAAEKLLKA